MNIPLQYLGELGQLDRRRDQFDGIGNADFWSLNPVLLASDKAAVLVCRRLRRLISAENAA